MEAGRYGVRDYTYNVVGNTGKYYKTVNITEFMNAKGRYSNDIYAYDSKGKLISTVHVSVDVK